MKIVLLGNHRVSYSSETHHKKSLEALGHTVIPMQESEARSEEVLSQSLMADIFVWIHTHGWPTPGAIPMKQVLDTLKSAGIPSVTYHLDLWLGLKRQEDLEKDDVYKHIEHFFTVDKQMAEWFNNNTTVKGHYLPAAAFKEECFMATPSPVSKSVIFVGSKRYHPEHAYRPQLIEWLQRTYGPHFEHWGGDGKGVVRGNQLNQLYADTRVTVGDSLCINFDYPYYWSDRVYETLGRGGFLIHPYVKGMEEHFVDKEHLVFYKYGDFRQLQYLINYYLQHGDERESIRQSGHNHVRNNHTYEHRWAHILAEVSK